MADVFISYARGDQDPVGQLATFLQTQGVTVWWDRNLAGGDAFHKVIENEINIAKKVIVVWSVNSIGSYWVRDEAQLAISQNKLVPIAIDDCVPPLGFRSIHARRIRDPQLDAALVFADLGFPAPAPIESPRRQPVGVSELASSDVNDQRMSRGGAKNAAGIDTRVDFELTLFEAFQGKRAEIKVPRSDGKGGERLLIVSIPAGVEDGTKIRLVGDGEMGKDGRPNGDLYVHVSVQPHPFFQRDGADVFCRVPISMTTAALGEPIEVPTLDGTITRVKIPEGSESGKQFRLKGKGMPVLRSKVVGDMYIQVEVETPKNLTRRQRQLLEDFKRESHKETSPESASFFARVKDFF